MTSFVRRCSSSRARCSRRRWPRQDRQRILDLYAKRGYYNARVDPQVIRLDQNRVDVVFQINDGSVDADQQDHLRRQSRVQRGPADGGDQQPRGALVALPVHLRRVRPGAAELRQGAAAPLLPEERLCRFRGAGREVRTGARPHPAFFLTFTISEGERYRIGKITINSQLRNLTGDDLRGDLEIGEGDWYDGDAVGRTVDAMELDVHNRGYAFVEVKPRIDARPREAHCRSRVRCRRGPARLCRADRHRRQHAHQGQGDPPRVPSGGR